MRNSSSFQREHGFDRSSIIVSIVGSSACSVDPRCTARQGMKTMATNSIFGAFTPLPVPSSGSPDTFDMSPPAALTQTKILPVKWENSGQTFWCWAAVAACIARYYQPGKNFQQCEIAKDCLESPCCTSPSSCNQMWNLEDALDAVGHSAGGPTFGTLDMTAIAQEINAGRPIGCLIKWEGGRGHFVAICGYDVNTMDVLVLDPASNLRPVPLDVLTYEYDGSGNWDSYYLTRQG